MLEEESCPYETEVNILITDNEGIRLYNREYRNIDRETDVLSFPNVPFEAPADFNAAEQYEADCFQPDSGELILGDIILSRDRILEQAESFGHSIRRDLRSLWPTACFICAAMTIWNTGSSRNGRKTEPCPGRAGNYERYYRLMTATVPQQYRYLNC